MKLRVALIFFVLFVAGIFVVFYLKDYFFLQSNIDHQKKQNITSQYVIETMNDSAIRLYDFNDKPLDRDRIYKLTHEAEVARVFHFWASWCDPCAVELPELISFAQKASQAKSLEARANAPQGLPGDVTKRAQIYLVSIDSEAEGLTRFTKVFPGITSKDFIQVWDKNNALSSRYGVDKLPMTIFVYSDNRIEIHNGVVNWKILQL